MFIFKILKAPARALFLSKSIHGARDFSAVSTGISSSIKAPFDAGLENKTKLLSDQEYREFMDEFPAVFNDLVNIEGLRSMEETNARVCEMIEYNVKNGKYFRASQIIRMAKGMQQKENGGDLPNLNRIAWIYEYYQSFAQIADDILDNSLTRRNRPCWYTVDNLGNAAFNDALLLENAFYLLLIKYVKDHYTCATNIQELIHTTSLQTIYGQNLDLTTSRERQFDRFSTDTYNKITTYKNGYYTFYTPIAFGLLLNGVKDTEVLDQVKKFALELNFLFTISDDYLDCFGDPETTGKVGTDIEDAKCSWLIVNALPIASNEQRKTLLENYGYHDPAKVQIVKNIYEDIGIPQLYATLQSQLFNKLQCQVQELPPVVPKEPLRNMIKVLFGRSR